MWGTYDILGKNGKIVVLLFIHIFHVKKLKGLLMLNID